MTDYQIAFDGNGDGFVAWDMQPGDALNLLPDPVRLIDMGITVDNGWADLEWEDTPYGTKIIVAFLDTGADAAYIGKAGAFINVIPVTPGQTYTAGLWIHADGDISSIATRFRIYNQAVVERANQLIAIDGDWQRYTLTFTAQAGDTHIALTVDKPNFTPNLFLYLAGPMLVTGTTLPDTFNSGDANDINDDITADVITLDWRLGMHQIYDTMAAPTTGRIIVQNNDGRYAPERGLIRLEPGTRVKVRAFHNGQTIHLISGWITHIEPETGALSGRTAVLHFTGPEAIMQEARILTSLLLSVAPDNILDIVLSRQPLDRLDTDFEVSDTRFAYAGDSWADGERAGQIIAQVVEAERGRFFSTRTGLLHFLDRHYLPNQAVNPTVFDDAFEAVDYVYGAGLINTARVQVRPRALGTPGSIVWQINNAQSIPASPECRVIVARFRDDYGNPIGATGVILPVATTDYTANTKADGTGADVTGQISMSFVSGGTASAVYLKICNSGTTTVYLQPGMQIRGTPLIQGDPMLVERQDDASIDEFGLHTLELNLPYFVTAEEAEKIADDLLLQRKRPFGMARSIELSHRIRFDDALTLSLYDPITVRESHTGHDADYLIIAESHEIDLGGTSHHVRWLLEPINPGGLWKLNRSKLDTATRLAVRF